MGRAYRTYLTEDIQTSQLNYQTYLLRSVANGADVSFETLFVGEIREQLGAIPEKSRACLERFRESMSEAISFADELVSKHWFTVMMFAFGSLILGMAVELWTLSKLMARLLGSA